MLLIEIAISILTPLQSPNLKLQKNPFQECDNFLTVANHEESNNQKLLHRRARVDLMPLNDLAAWAIRVDFLPGLKQRHLYIPLHFLT
jgi:hypothetical protein